MTMIAALGVLVATSPGASATIFAAEGILRGGGGVCTKDNVIHGEGSWAWETTGEGPFYVEWTMVVTYDDRCTISDYVCDIHVRDSPFVVDGSDARVTYHRHPWSDTSAEGDYRGVSFFGGNGSCGPCSVWVEGFVGGLFYIRGSGAADGD
ncbi:MAG: hypothetical protein ACT4PT_01695 [Methanobacteriota archaeon]